MTNTQIKDNNNTLIRSKTVAKSITKTNVADQLDSVVDYTDQQVPYKTYTALLSQLGTDAPTANILSNEANLTVVFTRTSLGKYKATLSAEIDRTKTPVLIGSGELFYINSASFQSTTIINIFTYDITAGVVTYYDDRLENTFFEIRVYN